MDQKKRNNRTPFIPGKSYIPAKLFAKYSAADLLKYGLRKWPDGTAVELNAGIYSHARLLVPMKQKITFQGPNWYVDQEDMGYSYED